ncbi:MAG TPA: DUF1003 domain-containing protein [Candidatus Dormibacteraeota bacterium]|nr:DUF1003 domain-containing protein [Candidatus Dormibacteraeota bacterium]
MIANETYAKYSRHQPENINQKHKNSLGFQDRLALLITTAVGTMYAVYFFAIFMTGWMLWQGAISHHPFDPYPFAFLLFLGNIIQLLLMPLIMVGQNIQGKHATIRADEEYKTTMTSYHDIEHILKHLNEQDIELLKQTKILQRLSPKN